MKAITLSSAGKSDNLRIEELSIPELKNSNEVLVRIKAAAVNPIDIKIRKALDAFPVNSPTIPGCDGAGIIEQIGAEVNDFDVGDSVYFYQANLCGRQGTYAQYACVESSLMAHKPKSLSFVEAAAAPLVLITAWESLFDCAKLRPEQSVFIPAGAGGVGHVAIQLAKMKGAKACTSVSTDEKARFARSLGADKIINYREQNTVEELLTWTERNGVDVAFDTLGGAVFQQCLDSTKPYGEVVTLLQPRNSVDWSYSRLKNLRISLEVMLSPIMLDQADRRSHQGEILKESASLFDNQTLQIQIAKTYDLTQAAEAQNHLENDAPIGKIVLTVD